ncbi:MAG TPA: TerC family protein [Terriglobales bacterium]|nr:TerC family protein [Terriglobales bacterium]
MESHELLFWIGFNLFVFAMLAIDLGVLNRKAHVVQFREALTWTGVWIALATSFAIGVYFWRGRPVALEFTTGYLVELALSVDNLFVFLLVFRFFKVPGQFQHKVLFWGILGALVMRGIFIYAGVALIHRFHWIIYVFGAFLIYTGIKLALQKETEVHPENNPVIRWFRKVMPVTHDYVGGKFFTRSQMGLCATPLFLVLLVVETTDVLFAADSIPAILAITRDSFIVYTSNVFAIMGLRSMYFALAGMMDIFHHLHYGLSAILTFIGVKMLISTFFIVPTGWALGIVAAVLALSVVASLVFPKKQPTLVQAESE